MKTAPYTVSQELLEALFDSVNMEIIKKLQEKPMTSLEIATDLSLEDPDVIEQLESLVEVGVAKRIEDDRGTLYELAHPNFGTIAELMEQTLKDRLRDDIDETEVEETEEQEL